VLCLSVFFLSVTSQFYRTASARTRLTQPDPQVVDASLLTALCYKVTRVSASSDGSSRMPQLVCCLGLIAVTTPCHYCATFVGCQWYSELSSKLLSSFGSVSMALLQSTCKSYALKWTASVVVPDYGLRQLAASSYQECKRLLHNGALLVTMGRQCGTVCQQHCEIVACHYTHSSGD